MNRNPIHLLVASVIGLSAGWFLTDSKGPKELPSAPTEASRDPLFALTSQPTSELPSTRTQGRGFGRETASSAKLDDLITRATELLAAPDAIIGMAGRIELAEVLSRIAHENPEAAIRLATQLPPGDVASSIIDSLTTALLDQHGSKAAGLIESSATPAQRHELLQHLMAAMALHDPLAAFELGQEKNLFRDSKGIHLLFLTWGERDPQGAAAAISKLTLSTRRKDASIALAASWVRTDPQAALAWVGGISPVSLQERCLGATLEQYAKIDPQAALGIAVNAPPLQSAALLSGVFTAWASKDPAAAVSAARELPAGRVRDQALAALGTSLVRTDPAMAAELLSDISPGPQAHALASSMAAEWAEIDAPATLKWLETLPDSLREKALEASLVRLAGNAPELAAEFAERATATPALADQIGAIAAVMASKDPAAAMAWAARFESETTATQIRQSALITWSQTDPVAALTAATALESQDRDSLITQVAERWAAADPKATLEWARSQQGDLGLALRGKAIESLASRDPVTARQEIEALFSDAGGEPKMTHPIPHSPHPLTESASALVRSLSYNDPQAATEWARALPEGSVRKEVLSRQYTDWATQDPAAAVRYAESSLQGWDRDWTLVSAVFGQIESQSTFASALDLAPRIQDPGERARAVRLIRNATLSPPDWRQQLLSRGFTADEINNAGD